MYNKYVKTKPNLQIKWRYHGYLRKSPYEEEEEEEEGGEEPTVLLDSAAARLVKIVADFEVWGNDEDCATSRQ